MKLTSSKILSPKTIGLTFFVCIFFLLFYPLIFKLIDSWEVDPNYSHGFFIPFISLYFIYTKRKVLKYLDITPSNTGLWVVVFGLLLFILSWLSSLDFAQGISMLVVLWGSILFLYGKQVARLLTFPICYLVFMIPLPAIVWNRLSVPLSLVASSISAKLMELMGLVVYREGNIITLPNITLQVVEACSGLRSLVTMMALGAALAYLSNFDLKRKIILFFLCYSHCNYWQCY